MTGLVAVTGGSGGAGHAVIQHLLTLGYSCLNIDRVAPRVELCPFQQVDMTDYAAVHTALQGADMLVHFAGMPHPDDDHIGAAERFNNNTSALFNAFNAAADHGIKRVVWASSETIFGFPFEFNRPDHVPLSETSRKQPQNGYALSKAISEDLAVLMAELHDMVFVGLRLSNVLYDDVDAVPSFQKIPGYWQNARARAFNLWGYVHSHDTARAVELGLTADLSGAEVFNIAATDTLMNRPTAELYAEVFPETVIDPGLVGHSASLDCSKAKRLLGWEPEFTWADVIGAKGERV